MHSVSSTDRPEAAANSSIVASRPYSWRSRRDTFRIGKVNVDENNKVAMTYNVASIPTIMIFKSGQLVQQFMGVQPKAKLQQALDEAKSA